MKTKIEAQKVLELIPDEYLENLEQEIGVNKQVKKLKGKLFFKLLIYSFLNTERVSLRVIEQIFCSKQFKIYTGDIGNNQTIRHSGIGERLDTIEYIFFEKIFDFLKEKYKSVLHRKSNKNIFQNIYKYDSTLVSLSSELIDFGIKGVWGKQTKKNQIKFTVGILDNIPDKIDLYTKQGEISENIALRETILKNSHGKDSIITFDRGLQKRKTLKEFDNLGINFVTRLSIYQNKKGGNKKPRYQEVGTYKYVKGRKTDTLILEEDKIVKLYDENNRRKPIDIEFRMIKAKRIDSGEEIFFLTNILDKTAKEITEIYKRRWDIEVFFKFLKQELNFKHFLSRSENGVQVVMYIALIAAILLLIYKTENNLSGYKIPKLRFAMELEISIMKDLIQMYDKQDILKILGPKNLAPT